MRAVILYYVGLDELQLHQIFCCQTQQITSGIEWEFRVYVPVGKAESLGEFSQQGKLSEILIRDHGGKAKLRLPRLGSAAQSRYPLQVSEKYVKAAAPAHRVIQIFGCRVNRQLNVLDACGRI